MASVLIAVDMPPTARPAPAPLPGATVKASSKDADKPVVGSATASAATASSGVLSGVVGQLQSLSTQISPFQSTLNLIKYLLIAIALVSAGLAIYAFWKQAKTKEALG
jgi:lysozyme family protein